LFVPNGTHVTKAKVVRLEQIRLLGKRGKNKMRKMKDSGIEWIGEIPEDWEVGRVKNCYIHHKYVVGDNADNYERLALTLNGVIKRSKVDATGLQPEAFEGYQILRQNELVFKLIDLENVSTSRVGYSPFTGIVSPAYIVLNPRNEKESRFGEYFFLSMWQREVFNHLGDDGVRSSLNAKDLLDIPYPLVSSDEKQKIVTFLDCKCSEIDSVISKTKSSIEEYQKLKQSIITETVTGKVKIENGKVCGKYDTYKDSGIEWIGEIPGEWSVIRTKFISDSMSKGNGITKEQIVQNGDSPCVRYGEIYSKYNHSFSNCITKTNKSMYTNLQYFSYGDILFACTGELPEEIGKNIVYLGNEDCLAGGDIIVMKHSQNPSFLNYVYNSYGQTQKSLGKTKLKVVHISATEIANIFVALPSLPVQQQIADFLDKKCSEIDKLITKKEQLVVELEAYKKSLIYEVVTGKREV